MSLFTYTIFERRYMLLLSLLCALSGAALFCSHELEDTSGLCLFLTEDGEDFSKVSGCVNGGAVIQFRSLYWLLFLQASFSVLLWNLLDSIHYNFSVDVGMPFTYKSFFASLLSDKFSSQSEGRWLMSRVAKVEFVNLLITSLNVFVMLKYLKIKFVDFNTATQNGLDTICSNNTLHTSSISDGYLQCFEYLPDGMIYKFIFYFALSVFVIFLMITLYNFLFSLIYIFVVCENVCEGSCSCKLPPQEMKNLGSPKKINLGPTNKFWNHHADLKIKESKWSGDEDE